MWIYVIFFMVNYFLKCVDFFVIFEFNIFLEKNVLVFLNKVFIYGYIFDVLDICEILVGEWENFVVYCVFLILRL